MEIARIYITIKADGILERLEKDLCMFGAITKIDESNIKLFGSTISMNIIDISSKEMGFTISRLFDICRDVYAKYNINIRIFKPYPKYYEIYVEDGKDEK